MTTHDGDGDLNIESGHVDGTGDSTVPGHSETDALGTALHDSDEVGGLGLLGPVGIGVELEHVFSAGETLGRDALHDIDHLFTGEGSTPATDHEPGVHSHGDPTDRSDSARTDKLIATLNSENATLTKEDATLSGEITSLHDQIADETTGSGTSDTHEPPTAETAPASSEQPQTAPAAPAPLSAPAPSGSELAESPPPPPQSAAPAPPPTPTPDDTTPVTTASPPSTDAPPDLVDPPPLTGAGSTDSSTTGSLVPGGPESTAPDLDPTTPAVSDPGTVTTSSSDPNIITVTGPGINLDPTPAEAPAPTSGPDVGGGLDPQVYIGESGSGVTTFAPGDGPISTVAETDALDQQLSNIAFTNATGDDPPDNVGVTDFGGFPADPDLATDADTGE